MHEYAPNRTKVLLTKILMGLVLVSAVAALVLTGNSGVINGSTGNQTIATIGDKKISAAELGNMYGHALQQSNLNDTMARQMGVPSMVLQREIDRQVMLQAAEKNGIRISNAYVAGQLLERLEQLEVAGTPHEKLQMVLAQQKLTEKELVELLRGDLAGELLAGIASPAELHTPTDLLLAQFRAAKETRIADLITITPASLKNQKTLADSDIQSYYDEHKENYRVPETRDVEVLVLPQNVFAKDDAVGEAEAKQYYDAHKDQFVGNDRVRVEQIIADSEESAKKILADKPANLTDYKADKAQKLKADWYSKNTLPKEFATVLYPTKPTGLVGPVKTPLGYHVLNVLSYDDAKPLEFTEARPAVEKAIKGARLDTQMTEFTDDIDNQITGSVPLKDIGDKYKQPVQFLTALQNNDTAKLLKNLPAPAQQRVLEGAFTTDAGEVGPLMDTTNGDYVLVHVLKVNPTHVPELTIVKDAVTADAQQADKAKNLTGLSEKLIGAYDAKNPSAFDNLVKENGLKVTMTKAQTKADIEKANGKEIAELLFTLSPDNALSYTQKGDSVTLVRLQKILPSDATPDDTAKQQVLTAVKGNMAQELQQQFSQALQQQVKVDVDMNALQNLFSAQPAAPAEQ